MNKLAKVSILIAIAGLIALFVFLKNKQATSQVDSSSPPNVNYKISNENSLYFYEIYSNTGALIHREGPISKCPTIVSVTDNLIMVTIQAGTGIGTQTARFYDVDKMRISNPFQGVLTQNGKYVVYSTYNKVIIQDIFDEHVFCTEIDEFNMPFSAVAFPFISAELTDEDTYLNVRISYLTGEEFAATFEDFLIKKT